MVGQTIPIFVELIAKITGLPSQGMDICCSWMTREKEKVLAEEMKKKYGTDRGTRGIIIKQINDAATQLGAKILACKLLRKCRRRKSQLELLQLQPSAQKAPQ
jgi:hypothetical protein